MSEKSVSQEEQTFITNNEIAVMVTWKKKISLTACGFGWLVG